MKNTLIPATIAFLMLSPVTFAEDTKTGAQTETSTDTEFKTAEELEKAAEPAIGEPYLR